MITITINKSKYQLPSTIDEFTLGHVEAITGEDDPFKKISYLSGATEKELRKLPKPEMMNLLYHITKSIEEGEISKDVEKSIKIDGEEYFVPEDIGEQTSGQWWDCEQSMLKLKGNENLYYAYAMAIYMLKKDEVYGEGDYDIEERVEIMKGMRYIDAANINVFFCKIDKEYSSSFKAFGEEEIVKKNSLLGKKS